MIINVENLISALPILVKGMVGIFIVTLVIILVIKLLNVFTSGKKTH
ncbi:MAG: hypothetical protein RR058_04870 [Oscillospiraceae bacterium]